MVLTLFGGSGLLLYAAGWLLIPDEGEEHSEIERLVGRDRAHGPSVGAIIVTVVGLIVLVTSLGIGAAVGHALVVRRPGHLAAARRRRGRRAWSGTPAGTGDHVARRAARVAPYSHSRRRAADVAQPYVSEPYAPAAAAGAASPTASAPTATDASALADAPTLVDVPVGAGGAASRAAADAGRAAPDTPDAAQAEAPSGPSSARSPGGSRWSRPA